MKLLSLAVLIHTWTPLAEATIGSEAYRAALPRRLRDPHKAIRKQVVRGNNDSRRTLHGTVQSPATLPDMPTVRDDPKTQYGKTSEENSAYSPSFESSPSIRGRELLPFTDGSSSDDLLVGDATKSVSFASMPLILLDTMSQPIMQFMSMIDASVSMRMNDASSNDMNFPNGPSIPLDPITMQQMSMSVEIELSLPTEPKSMSYHQKLVESEISMSINDVSSDFPNRPSTEPLESMSMRRSSGMIMSLEFSGVALELSMPIQSNSLSFNQKLMSSSMSDDEMSFSNAALSVPLALNYLSMSMPMQDEKLSFMYGALSVPLTLNDLSMSTPVQDAIELSFPSESLSLLINNIDTFNPSISSAGDFELSMSLELNELSTLIEIGDSMYSMPLKPHFVSNEMSLSMMMMIDSSIPITSSSQNLEMSMPWELNELDFGDISMQPGVLDAILPNNSPTHTFEYSMPSKLNYLSMSLELSEYSMSMDMFEHARPTNSPTLVLELLLMESDKLSLSMELNDLNMSIEIAETLYPTQSPSTREPASADSDFTGQESPTQYPQTTPMTDKITVEAEARLDLVGMYSLMDDETTAIFERSCSSFFGDMFAGSRPLVDDVQCKVTDQMLLSERRLRPHFAQGIRRDLEEESSLLVDLIVLGTTDSDSNSHTIQPSDISFTDLVDEISMVHSMGFVTKLKEDANNASIDDFKRLTSINYIGGNDITRDIDSASESNVESDDSGKKGKIIAISSMLVCGVLILGMFLSNYVERRKRYPSKLKDATNRNRLDERFEQQSPKPGSLYQDLTPRNFQEVTPKNEQLTYMYSLDDGLATPSSIASHSAGSPLSAAEKMQQTAQCCHDEELAQTNRIRVDIVAPPGKLGIIIDTCSEGPIVHNVKPNSPLEGLIFKGDLVIAVDDEDTREWSAHYLTKLMVSTYYCHQFLDFPTFLFAHAPM